MNGELRRLFHWRSDFGPIGFLTLAIAVAAAALIFTLILPALLAAQRHVFYESDLRQKLKPAQRKILSDFDADQQKRQVTLDAIDKAIGSELADAQHASTALILYQIRDQVRKEKDNAKPRIHAIPFYLSQQMLLWPAIYTCLAWIAIILTPAGDLRFWHVFRSRKTIEIGLIIYFFYEWPLWLRNFVLTDENRTVYAYTNHEIDLPSFIMQEVTVFGFCMLLAVIWRQWSIYLVHVRHDDPHMADPKECIALLSNQMAASSFADVFFRWVTCSVLLGAGFIGFTAFFWDLVGKLHDRRYLISAILAHTLWGLTWIVLSLPLVNEWRLWNRCRTYAYQALATLDDATLAKKKLALAQAIQPVAPSTLATANVTSLLSFVFPIVQAFLK